MLHAKNSKGEATRNFKIIVGDRIALTPPMGWCSWNCMDSSITQEKILPAARLMVSSGLSQHGYTYVNMDDGWQGERTGPGHALMGNADFPTSRICPRRSISLGSRVESTRPPAKSPMPSLRGEAVMRRMGSGPKWSRCTWANTLLPRPMPNSLQPWDLIV